MTARPTYAAAWRARYDSQRDVCLRLLASDTFEYWDGDPSPDSQSCTELVQGLRVFWGGDEATAGKFFERALALADRIDKEHSYVASEELGFPRNRARHLRIRVHAAGLLGTGDRSDETAESLIGLLDRIRSPDHRSDVFMETELVCLELALIYEMIFGAGEPLDWRRAARLVAE